MRAEQAEPDNGRFEVSETKPFLCDWQPIKVSSFECKPTRVDFGVFGLYLIYEDGKWIELK